jgi:hypothetical protein
MLYTISSVFLAWSLTRSAMSDGTVSDIFVGESFCQKNFVFCLDSLDKESDDGCCSCLKCGVRLATSVMRATNRLLQVVHAQTNEHII